MVDARHVLARYLTAALEQDFEKKVEELLAYAPANPPPKAVRDFRNWLADTFHFQTRTTPKGYKREKEELDRFYRALEVGESGIDLPPHLQAMGSGLLPGAFTHTLESLWSQMRSYVPTWVSVFSSSEGAAKPVTRKVERGGHTFINEVGASDKKFEEMIRTIEGVFADLRGWRKKALAGGVVTVFKGPKDFHGTASGIFKRALDQLWIRATPGGRIDRAGSGYGGLAYVITHELGHRYEDKNPLPEDFERAEWVSSRYSLKEGEKFAELFALSNFGITNQGHPETIERFVALMGG
jgi:hypothetical protein